ncbi:PAS fold protein [Planctomycetes bacterium CA13]|uniref:histidine kinase n=1 Tax=Novipirellula herctigrandis TaxID=2527986 RepID=A0A5C5Z4X2_9BACT|nr:PAS fold protein [Planctomycetes bacterium CA13]
MNRCRLIIPKKFVHPDDFVAEATVWQECMEDRTVYEREHRLPTIHGEYRWFLSRGIPIRDEDDQIECWYGTSTDIQELKDGETNLIEQRDKNCQSKRWKRSAV